MRELWSVGVNGMASLQFLGDRPRISIAHESEPRVHWVLKLWIISYLLRNHVVTHCNPKISYIDSIRQSSSTPVLASSNGLSSISKSCCQLCDHYSYSFGTRNKLRCKHSGDSVMDPWSPPHPVHTPSFTDSHRWLDNTISYSYRIHDKEIEFVEYIMGEVVSAIARGRTGIW